MSEPAVDLKRLTEVIRKLAEDGANVSIRAGLLERLTELDLTWPEILAFLCRSKVVRAVDGPREIVAEFEAEWDEQLIDGKLRCAHIEVRGVYGASWNEICLLIVEDVVRR